MLSLPSQTERNWGLKSWKETLVSWKKKKEIFFKKACRFKKELYFCSR